MKCTVKWIDPMRGDIPTPDNNDAVGMAVYWTTRRHAFNLGHDGGAPPEVSGAYPICAEHAKRMPIPGWTLAPFGFDPTWLAPPELCNDCKGTGRLSALLGAGFCKPCHGCGLLAGQCNLEIANAQHFEALCSFMRTRPEDVRNTFADSMLTLAKLSRRFKVRLTPDGTTDLFFVSEAFCGGVIYHGAGDTGVGGPSYAVRFGTEECWQIHT